MSNRIVTDMARRRVIVLLLIVAAIVVAYWALWFGHRSLVASETSPAYQQFEDAFPMADGWLVLCLLGAAWSLKTRRDSALGWLLAGGGAGLYLFSMDVLYDAEHGIWTKGGNGVIEATINVATLVISLGMLRWTWRRRAGFAVNESHRRTGARTVSGEGG